MPSDGELPCLLAKKAALWLFKTSVVKGVFFFPVAEKFLFNLGALKALGIIC